MERLGYSTREQWLTAAARNLAGWHDCSVRALGFPTRWGRWWWTAPTPGPWIYFTAIELRRPGTRVERAEALDELRAHLADPAGSFEAICDTFGVTSADRLGFRRQSQGRWYGRPAAPVDDSVPPTGGTISEVTTASDLAVFERATCRAFGAPEPVTAGDIHGTAVLDDPAMRVLIGRDPDSGDEAAAGAMAYLDGGVLGLYGVGTVPAQRGRGWASALTLAGLALDPEAPATLQPSAEAASMYRRLGFVDLGPYSHWS